MPGRHIRMDAQLYSILNSALDTCEYWHVEWTCHLIFHYPLTSLKIEAVVSPKPWCVFIELNTAVPETKILLKHLMN